MMIVVVVMVIGLAMDGRSSSIGCGCGRGYGHGGSCSSSGGGSSSSIIGRSRNSTGRHWDVTTSEQMMVVQPVLMWMDYGYGKRRGKILTEMGSSSSATTNAGSVGAREGRWIRRRR